MLSSSSSAGSSPSLSSTKPRSRGLFSSLFCCLCRDQPEPPPVNNNAPLLVEENGTVSKVCPPSSSLSPRVVQSLSLSHFAVVCVFQIQVKPLLPPVKSKDSGKLCVVIDLDETLVHSSFKVRKTTLITAGSSQASLFSNSPR